MKIMILKILHLIEAIEFSLTRLYLLGVYDPNNVFWSIDKKYQDRINLLDKNAADFNKKEYELIKLKEHRIVWHTEMLRNFTIISWIVSFIFVGEFFEGKRTMMSPIVSVLVTVFYTYRLWNSNKNFEADPLVLEKE